MKTTPGVPGFSGLLKAAALALAVAGPTVVAAQPVQAAPATVKDGFTFAAAGDMIGPEGPVLKFRDPGTLAVQQLLSGADVAFANQEGAIFDLDAFAGYPAAENGGGHPVNFPAEAADLKALGIKMLSQANNHATDFGVEGMAATSRVLDGVGIAHAGTGPSLTAARAPVYVKTDRGVVALVAAAGTFTDLSVAADAKPDDGFKARPGLSPLHTRPAIVVTESQMATLREIASRTGEPAQENAGADLTLGQTSFRIGTAAGITYPLDAGDEAAVLASIKEARAHADLVVFSVHAHEMASARSDETRPADYLRPMFHKLVDAGADVIVRHGPHDLQGVEIYKGRPIFYGMGSLMFQVGDMNHHFRGGILPDRWYDSAIAVSEFRNGQVSIVRIYPFVQNEQDVRLKGTPKVASHEDAQRILRRIKALSVPFGTEVAIEGDVGVINLDATVDPKGQ